ncbi:MAG TPA: hypothetical protein VFR84_12965 [Candidatus Angelobacter sp.]|nr:hypothetical protein [Candidatus Angelobacter sp.]
MKELESRYGMKCDLRHTGSIRIVNANPENVANNYSQSAACIIAPDPEHNHPGTYALRLISWCLVHESAFSIPQKPC